MNFEVIPTPVVVTAWYSHRPSRGPDDGDSSGGSGDVTTNVAWTSPRGSPFVPSGIVVGDLLYLINDMQSILTVYEAATGKLVYQDRLGVAIREGFSASPVHVNGKIFLTNDDGQTFVVEAGRQFKLLRTNELGEQTLPRLRWSTALGMGAPPIRFAPFATIANCQLPIAMNNCNCQWRIVN